MADITIAAETLVNYHEVGSVHELRLFSDRSWTASDDTPVPGRGNNDTYYASYTLTVNTTLFTAAIPSVTLKSNQDALNTVGKVAKWTAQIFVDGVPRDVFMPNVLGAFTVPSSPAGTTWGALETVNSIRRDIPASPHPTLTQVQNLINIAIGTLNDASVSVKGRSFASVAPLIASSPTFAGTNDPRILANIVNVKNAPYYAVGDGSADDTAALVAAIAALDAGGGGTLYLPIGIYNHTGLTAALGASQHYINIWGAGQIPTVLRYVGSTSGRALTLFNEKFPSLRGFTIRNGVAKGTTEGVRAAGTFGGTNSNGLVIESVGIENFATGWRTSDGAAHTSSEIAFIGLRLSDNDTGFLNDDFNGISFNFYNLIMSANVIGIDAETSNIHVYGGSASANGTDFKFVGNGNSSINGYYSENATFRFIVFSPQSFAHKLSVLDCLAQMASPNTATSIEFSGGTGAMSVSDCNLGGKITMANGALSLKNCGIIDPSNTFTPIANPTLMGPGFRLAAASGRFESFGNTQFNGNFDTFVASWPDCSGVTLDYDGGGDFRAIVTVGNSRASAAASATSIVPNGQFFHVTGTTNIDSIVPTGLPIGMVIRLIFDGVLTVSDGGGNLKLNGNFVTSANDSLTLMNDDGVSWVELCRSAN